MGKISLVWLKKIFFSIIYFNIINNTWQYKNPKSLKKLKKCLKIVFEKTDIDGHFR